MNLKYLIIGVRDTNIQKLEAILNEEGKVFELSNVDVTIEDVREDLLMVKKFLIENDLKDDDPFFNEFDMMPYSLQVDFTVIPSYKYLLVLESYVFSLAQMISATLKVECLVMFENMQMPVSLFKDGVLIETFHKYNSEFFKSRCWRPSDTTSMNFS